MIWYVYGYDKNIKKYKFISKKRGDDPVKILNCCQDDPKIQSYDFLEVRVDERKLLDFNNSADTKIRYGRVGRRPKAVTDNLKRLNNIIEGDIFSGRENFL